MTNKKGAPLESAGEPEDPFNFDKNDTPFRQYSQAYHCLEVHHD
jgi:hypothetical protein